MKVCLIPILFLILIVSCKKPSVIDPSSDDYIETSAPILTPVIKRINPLIGGYYSGLPAHYQASSKRYPLIIFIHGGGQLGDGNHDLHTVLNDGIPELLDQNVFPPYFQVNGKYYSFIVLAPQFANVPTTGDVNMFIDYALKTYRIDTARMYLSGLSMGGILTCDVAAKNPSLFAAIVPIAGVSRDDINEKCKRLSDGKVPLWLFHNEVDHVISVNESKHFIEVLNSFKPTLPPKFTIFPTFGINGHDAWTKAADPTYKEENKNIYEWMLQYSR